MSAQDDHLKEMTIKNTTIRVQQMTWWEGCSPSTWPCALVSDTTATVCPSSVWFSVISVITSELDSPSWAMILLIWKGDSKANYKTVCATDQIFEEISEIIFMIFVCATESNSSQNQSIIHKINHCITFIQMTSLVNPVIDNWCALVTQGTQNPVWCGSMY